MPEPEVPEPSPSLAAWFGGELDRAREFVRLLCTSGAERGLIGPREVPRIWERHVGNCAVVADLVPDGAAVVDVGSGAGLPGLALAVARPRMSVTLVEPMLRRTAWLEEAVAALDLGHVTVVRARAEEVRGRVAGDVVTSRAVARLDVLGGWCLPLVRPGGEVLALKGASAEEEVGAARAALLRSGATGAQVVRCGVGVLEVPTTVVRVAAGRVEPRRSGRSARRQRRP